MIAFPVLRGVLPIQLPKARRPAAAERTPAPLQAPDRFERRPVAGASFDAGGRDALVAQLARANAGLTWAASPGEKTRLLAAMAKLKTDAAADALMAAYAEAGPGLPVVRHAALARVFQTLLAPGDGALSAAKREETLAFVLKAFKAQGANGDVHLQLGYALALSGAEAGADALIANYKRAPATGVEGVHRGLNMLAFCPHPKVSAFLAGEHERLGANEAARVQVLATLLDQLDRAAP